MTQTVGGRIRAIRGTRGVAEFADALGVNRKTVARWEADEALPDGASLLALNEKFGADAGWVLTGKGEPPSDSTLTTDERELLALYRAASLTGKMAAVGALQGAVGASQPKAKQVFHGEVGQVVEGGLKNTKPVTFNVGGRKKKGE